MPREETSQQASLRVRGKRIRTIQADCHLIGAKVIQDEALTIAQLDAVVVALDLAKRFLVMNAS